MGIKFTKTLEGKELLENLELNTWSRKLIFGFGFIIGSIVWPVFWTIEIIKIKKEN